MADSPVTCPSVCLQAFFLVYSLGCLSVYMHQVTATSSKELTRCKTADFLHSIGQEPLSIIQLWNTFRALRPDFVSSFAAYQHFRSKGWIPKEGGGAKYGVDLSKTQPPHPTTTSTQSGVHMISLYLCLLSVVPEGATVLPWQVADTHSRAGPAHRHGHSPPLHLSHPPAATRWWLSESMVLLGAWVCVRFRGARLRRSAGSQPTYPR